METACLRKSIKRINYHPSSPPVIYSQITIYSIKGTKKCIVYEMRCLVVQSFSSHYHRAMIQFKIRGIETLLGEIKASFDWHNPADNETVLLPLLH